LRGYKDSSGKFHPITDYKKVTRKSRDQQLKTKGVRLKHVQRQILNPKGARQKYNQWFWDDLPTITRVLIIGDEIDIETSYLDLPPKQRNQVDSALEQKRLLDEVIQNPNKETMEAFKNKKSLKKRDVPLSLNFTQKDLYHATTLKNAKDIIKNGFNTELIGVATTKRRSEMASLMFGNRPNSGEAFYFAKSEEDALSFGKTVLKINLKDNTKILNLEGFWLTGDKTPPKIPFIDEIKTWYPEYILRFLKQKGIDKTDPQHFQVVKKHWSQKENLDHLIEEVDPRSGFGKFSPTEFTERMIDYAKDHDYDGINFDSADTILFTNEPIKSIELVKKK